MKILVVKEFSFAAAHYLPEYDGPCKQLHGHEFKLQIGINGEVNKRTGMVVDFNELKEKIKVLLINLLDHSCLNHFKEMDGFPCTLPTAENMLIWMHKKLVVDYPFQNPVELIRLYETPTSYVEWRA